MPLGPVAYLVPLGFCAGLIDSIAGGGGLVSVPALLAANLPPHLVIGTNKGQSTLGNVGSFASYWRLGNVDRDRAPVAFVAGLAGGSVGALALLSVRPEPLRPIILGLLAFAGLVVLLRGRLGRGPSRAPDLAHPLLVLAPLAFGLGVYDGFFGPGVGSLLIAAFTLVFGDSLTRASGNAKVANLGSNVAALLVFAWRGTVIWAFALPMALANVAGAMLGSRLAFSRGDRFVRAVVLAVVGVILAKTAYATLRGP
jgi:uncharacterized membrane protein YfcA